MILAIGCSSEVFNRILQIIYKYNGFAESNLKEKHKFIDI